MLNFTTIETIEFTFDIKPLRCRTYGQRLSMVSIVVKKTLHIIGK
jgi:hypothetical protein